MNGGRCPLCSEPYDDHKLPHVNFPSDGPVCRPITERTTK